MATINTVFLSAIGVISDFTDNHWVELISILQRQKKPHTHKMKKQKSFQ